MIGELVTVVTEDQVRLDGFYSQSTFAQDEQIDITAAIIVHGLSGNFYQSKLLKHFATELQSAGISTLLVNTRGHDYLNSTPRMGKAATLGAAVEIIDECKYDLYTWAKFVKHRGHEKLMLMGHSLGAIKSLYCQAHHPHPNVTRIAAFSATRLSYDSLLASSGGQQFSHWLAKSKQMVAENRGNALMYVDFPFPTWMSANAYLNKYGEHDKYDWLSFKEQITVPTLTVFGERELEENPAFNAMKHDLQNIDLSNFNVHYIPHADHFYSACFEPASFQLFEWLKRTQSLD